MADINPEQREAMERFYEALQGATRSMGPLEQEERLLAETTKKTSERLETLGRNISQFGRDFGSTMTSASEGTAKYGQATRSAAKAAGDLFGSFGFLGKAIGGIIKLFGGLAASTLEQNEKLVKSYQNLSEFGAIDSSGVEGVLKDLQNVKLLTDQAGILENALKRLQPELAALSGSAYQGRKDFTNVMKNLIGGKLEVELRKLGYTQEQIADHAAQYLAREARLGNTQTKNTQQLTENTGKYLKELQELTMLTGLSREEQERIRDQQLAEVRFNDYLEELRGKGQIEAADRLQSFSVALEKFSGKETAAGFREQLVNYGAVVNDASVKFQMATRGAGYQIGKAVEAGSMDLTTALRKTGEAGTNTWKALGRLTAISPETAEALGQSNEAQRGFRQMQKVTTKEALEQMLKETEMHKGRMDEEAKRAMTERDYKLMLDKLNFAIGDKVIPLFTKLAEVTRYLAKTFAKIVDKFGHFVGMGDLNLSASFATTLEDATEILQTEEKKLADLTKERTKVEQQLIKAQKEKLELEEEEKKGFGVKAPWKYQDLTRARANESRLTKDLQEIKERQGAAKTNVSDLKDIKKSHEEAATAKSAADTAKAAAARKSAATTDERRTDITESKKPAGSPYAKLNLKSDESTAGGEASPKLIALAEKIQEIFPNAKFTALDDAYHRSAEYKKKTGGKVSSHEKGTALDMTLPEDQRDTQEKRDEIRKQLSSLGFSKVVDEYAKLSGAGTGGHFHAEIPQALHGGLFSGPATGYNVKMHSDELVIPKDNPAVKKTPLNDLNLGSNDTTAMMDMFTSKLEAKFDTMIEYMSRSQMTQEELLQYTRA